MDWDRVEAARQRGRSLLVLVCVLIAAVAFGLVAEPATIGGMLAGIPISSLPTAIGLVGMFIGLAWMWRIHRAPTKDKGAQWRFRDR
jgi:hypothetical protein